jgi:hypothetical protein
MTMGSTRPKWLIKQERERIAAARRAARKAKGPVRDLGVPRMARHGHGLKQGQGV